MQNDKQIEFPLPPKKIADQICELSSNQHYILIYPRDDMLKGEYKSLFNDSMNPYLLVFEDEDNTTSLDLARQYIQENNLKIKPQHLYFWEYRTEYLFREMKLSGFKWDFQEDTIDGYCFRVSILEMNIKLQAKMQQLVNFDNKLKSTKSIAFYVPQNKSYFYIKQEPQDKFATFCNKIVNQIKKSYKVTVKAERLQLTIMLNGQKKEVTAQNYKNLNNKLYVYVTFLDKVDLPKQQFKNQSHFIMIQDYGKQEQFKFPYMKVRSMRVDTILDKQLGFKQRGLNSIQFGLRIHDLIIKPIEMLSDHDELEQNFFTQSKYVKIVLAYVIKQSFLFYAHLENIEKINSTKNKNIFKSILDKSTGNENHRRSCEEVIRERAKTTPHKAFKKEENIEPILYYTSELKVNEGNRSIKLYDAYNTFLRKMQFGTIDTDEYDKWQFLFTRSLVKALNLIEPYKGDLYRGVSHPETYKIGKILKYKQFNSCSTDINVAKGFAGKALYIFKNCKMGRNILDYSYFQEEDEVLNLPYSQYRIIDIKQTQQGQKTLDVVTMEEVDAPKLKFDLSDQPQLFVLWVDGEKGEGVQFSKNIHNIRQSTFFIHLSSTKDLQDWLKNNKKNLEDKTISTVLITNMARTENGSRNEIAGVLAIKAYKNACPQGKVMVYIGDIVAAQDKLTKNHIPVNSVTIGNSAYSLLQFFLNCGIS